MRESLVILESEFAAANALSAGLRLPDHLLTAHPSRKTEWLAGRYALTRALSEIGHQVKAKDLQTLSHHRILGAAQYRFSISHTSSHAGCWAVHDEKNQIRIGFDIENSSRQLSPLFEKRIRSVYDQPLSSLELWCAKEAIFKSIDSEYQKRLGFSKIRLSTANEFELSECHIIGHYDIYRDLSNSLIYATSMHSSLQGLESH